ncbi:MAG: hypothetical protein JNL11_16485 [Bdellovibrionaceae bacterium]|nr:hypothetical protein [Pseudobdellovibrionaceae bacterium]
MNFFNFKSRFLKFLIIGTSVSFSLASHANSCLHFYSYKHQDPFIWQRESRPYFDAVSLIEGKNVHPFYAAKIKNKHRILQAHVDAKNLTQNIMGFV